MAVLPRPGKTSARPHCGDVTLGRALGLVGGDLIAPKILDKEQDSNNLKAKTPFRVDSPLKYGGHTRPVAG